MGAMDHTAYEENHAVYRHPRPGPRWRRRVMCAGGEARTVYLRLPAGYRPGPPIPLVLNLHGIGADAAHQEALSGMGRVADEAGFAVACPEALDAPGWDAPTCWNIRERRDGPDDLAFLRALIERLCADPRIDPARIYATGHSNGAGMVDRLACHLAEYLAAIGPVAGAYPLWRECAPACPVPVVAFHGTADEVVPYGGLGDALPPIRAWAAAWADRNGCDPQPEVARLPGGVIRETWGARTHAPVTLYTVVGGGHDWPRAGRAGIDATEVIWAFFRGIGGR
jgi:polyhydroxybutyrate depolymerase